jgi:GPI ethanolamine phosphate transferase 3 subunit O
VLEVLAAHPPSLRTSPLGPIALALLGSFHFFKTGHNATFASIQWDAVFIPLRTPRFPWAPLFLVINTFSAQLLCAVAVPLTQLWKVPPRKPSLMGDVARAMAQHILFYAVISLATTLWAGHLRRHLMLYRVFMPRFMMAGLVGVVVQVFGAIVAIGGLRWSFLSVGEVFGWA